ncbi:MAG: hypothetical protein KatS3mg085_735 [Candidatus Dojkabacteria bacterium]|nr:MAG: hypothetical protein KatS3mg085_735 [Candidatus Dojkabacteria bacterium]GIW58744.1 MAG: hypothetical protein KatS3mg086_029 [Candidatus Dojkabacteria bacterium]
MSSRKIAIAIFTVLTLLLGVASVYIGFMLLQEDTAPDDSSASTYCCGRILCNDGSEAGDDRNSPFECNERARIYCADKGGVRQANIDPQVFCSTTGTPGAGPSCSITNVGGALRTTQACSSSLIVKRFEKNYYGTDTKFSDCFVSEQDSNEPGYSLSVQNLNPGATYDPYAPCKCVQIDIVNNVSDPNPIAATCRCSGGFECQPPETPEITCYRCTPQEGDGDACESQTFQAETCPAGYTSNPNCNQAVGGSCEAPKFCGDTCVNSQQCPEGNVCSNGRCVLTECTQGFDCDESLCNVINEKPEIPETAIFDSDNSRLLIGLSLLVSALVATQIDYAKLDLLFQNILKSLNSKPKIDKANIKLAKKTFLRSRNKFEKKILKNK